MLFKAVDETEAIRCQAAAAGSVEDRGGDGCAGRDVGNGAGGLKGEERGLEGVRKIRDVDEVNRRNWSEIHVNSMARLTQSANV
jgi:hypothetical protein